MRFSHGWGWDPDKEQLAERLMAFIHEWTRPRIR